MGYPVRVAFEFRRVEVVEFELVVRVENGGHAIALLDHIEPDEGYLAQLLGRQTARFLNIEHRREVAFFEMHLLQEVSGLRLGGYVGLEVMVGTAQEAKFAGLVEVVVEVLVQKILALGSLDEHKANGLVAYLCP